MSLRPGLSYYLFHWLWSGVDLLFPPRCAGCGKLGQRWCQACRRQLAPPPEPICEICGEPQPQPGICPNCSATRPAFYALRSCAVFKEPLRPALHHLKYRQNRGLAEALAWDCALFLDRLHWQAEVIVPVPLSEQRMRERGYNQAGLIAHSLARLMNWTYQPHALQRIRHTRSQVGLSAAARRENVRAAFSAQDRLVNGKIILLFDDVATTGATLHSASEALRAGGAKRVYALTVAKALPKYGLDRTESFSARSSR
ncbi:MAG: ComF family protein [Anaerolineales bacterium]|nr:ComF family protein [Anaerolineales bacterium]